MGSESTLLAPFKAYALIYYNSFQGNVWGQMKKNSEAFGISSLLRRIILLKKNTFLLTFKVKWIGRFFKYLRLLERSGIAWLVENPLCTVILLQVGLDNISLRGSRMKLLIGGWIQYYSWLEGYVGRERMLMFRTSFKPSTLQRLSDYQIIE